MGNQFLQNSLDSTIRMHTDGVDNYWFYHKDSFPNDAPDLYRRIISNAATYIEIWDPWLFAKVDSKFFSTVQHKVTIKILTTLKEKPDPKEYASDFWNALKLIIPENKMSDLASG